MTEAKVTRSRQRKPRRARGALLTVWIIVLGGFGVLTAVAGLLQQSALSIATSAFLVVCALGLWSWQRWAYFALLVSLAIVTGVILIAVLSGPATNLVQFAFAIAMFVVTVALIQPRLDEFR